MKTLLIADDEPGIRSLVKMTLEDADYEILEASDGNQALATTRARHPDLVILDVAMPGLSGIEVCKRIKSDPETAGTIVMMLTARAQDIDRVEGILAGADDYFTKPFSPIALINKVEQILRGAPSR